jgi:hypothetical protein
MPSSSSDTSESGTKKENSDESDQSDTDSDSSSTSDKEKRHRPKKKKKEKKEPKPPKPVIKHTRPPIVRGYDTDGKPVCLRMPDWRTAKVTHWRDAAHSGTLKEVDSDSGATHRFYTFRKAFKTGGEYPNPGPGDEVFWKPGEDRKDATKFVAEVVVRYQDIKKVPDLRRSILDQMKRDLDQNLANVFGDSDSEVERIKEDIGLYGDGGAQVDPNLKERENELKEELKMRREKMVEREKEEQKRRIEQMEKELAKMKEGEEKEEEQKRKREASSEGRKKKKRKRKDKKKKKTKKEKKSKKKKDSRAEMMFEMFQMMTEKRKKKKKKRKKESSDSSS